MTLEQFLQLLVDKQREIEQVRRRTLPVKVGRLAKDHFQEGFRRGGFTNDGFHPWQRKKRPDKYGPLLSDRNHLYGSIYARPGDARVTVGTEVPYAEIHNEGGNIVVTPRMKRYFWARYREANGGTWTRGGKNPEAEFWKLLALKKTGSTIHIPRRQFIGDSRELDEKIDRLTEEEIEKVILK